MNLSVIMPVSNEVESVQVILKRVHAQNLAHDIVVVGIGLKDVKDGVRVILHERNKVKGAGGPHRDGSGAEGCVAYSECRPGMIRNIIHWGRRSNCTMPSMSCGLEL